QSRLLASLGLAVKLLRLRSRAPHITQPEHFNFELSTFRTDPQHIADTYLPRRLCHLPVRHNPVQIAALLRQRPRLEKPRRPQPCIHPNPCHSDILSRSNHSSRPRPDESSCDMADRKLAPLARGA